MLGPNLNQAIRVRSLSVFEFFVFKMQMNFTQPLQSIDEPPPTTVVSSMLITGDYQVFVVDQLLTVTYSRCCPQQ
jgi:hypothetical protein